MKTKQLLDIIEEIKDLYIMEGSFLKALEADALHLSLKSEIEAAQAEKWECYREIFTNYHSFYEPRS